MIWQLLQVRHLDVPLVFAGQMWKGLVDWAGEQMLRPGFELAKAADIEIHICVADEDEHLGQGAQHGRKPVDDRRSDQRDPGGVLPAQRPRCDAHHDVVDDDHEADCDEHCLPAAVEDIESDDRDQDHSRDAGDRA